MYKLREVTKEYPKDRRTVAALRKVNLDIGDGEWLAVQGRTGHGKTTLLQMLGALDRPTSGTIEFQGADLARRSDIEISTFRARSIGFIFQTFNLVPTLNAQENVEAALVPLGLREADRRRRASDALEDVGLGDRRRHFPSELSGGQQQRVAIARALVKKPPVLLADEPTGNLDTETRREIIGLLEALWRNHRLTMVLVTHDRSIARKAQRIAVLDRGRVSIQQDGSRRPV